MDLPYKVDPSTKRDLVLILCSLLEGHEIDYGTLHKASKIFQANFERKYGATLGYKFNDISIYKPWDDEFQRDLERWDAVSKLITISDRNNCICLKVPRRTKLLLSIAKENLEKKFDGLKEFVKEIEEKLAD